MRLFIFHPCYQNYIIKVLRLILMLFLDHGGKIGKNVVLIGASKPLALLPVFNSPVEKLGLLH